MAKCDEWLVVETRIVNAQTGNNFFVEGGCWSSFPGNVEDDSEIVRNNFEKGCHPH